MNNEIKNEKITKLLTELLIKNKSCNDTDITIGHDTFNNDSYIIITKCCQSILEFVMQHKDTFYLEITKGGLHISANGFNK